MPDHTSSAPDDFRPVPTRFGTVTTPDAAEEAWAGTLARMDVCERLGVQPHPGDIDDNTRLLDALGTTDDAGLHRLFDKLEPRIHGKTQRIVDALNEIVTQGEKTVGPGQRRLPTTAATLAASDFPASIPRQPGPGQEGKPSRPAGPASTQKPNGPDTPPRPGR